ncbi:MAG TPA: hypothetical protein VL026_05595 [Rhizomicrobium sp.]|nr:hypothetical protein [Rhizomicrobium sp.]
MRIVVLQSDIATDAPPDERDTLLQAEAIVQTLRSSGHTVAKHTFPQTAEALSALLEATGADLIFNVVESVEGSGFRAAEAIALFEQSGVVYTGNASGPMAVTCDKLLTKRRLAAAGLPTPDWAAPPDWQGLSDSQTYIVKSAREDASLGLDDGAVCTGRARIAARADFCAGSHGGDWFAERYVDGREFNIALLEVRGRPVILPIAEMRFEAWPSDKPKIVGYAAKWDEQSHAATHTVRDFTWTQHEPALAAQLEDLSRQVWALFDLNGYARVDFRVDAAGAPTILEINPNPCLEAGAGFAAAARQADLSYAALIEHIVAAARTPG